VNEFTDQRGFFLSGNESP